MILNKGIRFLLERNLIFWRNGSLYVLKPQSGPKKICFLPAMYSLRQFWTFLWPKTCCQSTQFSLAKNRIFLVSVWSSKVCNYSPEYRTPFNLNRSTLPLHPDISQSSVFLTSCQFIYFPISFHSYKYQISHIDLRWPQNKKSSLFNFKLFLPYSIFQCELFKSNFLRIKLVEKSENVL